MKTEGIVEGGVAVTKKIVTWRINNFPQMFNHDLFFKHQKMTFEVKDSNGFTSIWAMSLNFKDDSKHHTPTSTTNSGSSNHSIQCLSLVVALVSTTKPTLLSANIVPSVEGQNGSSVYKGSLGPGASFMYEPGKAKSWPILNFKKYSDISYLFGKDGPLMIQLEVSILNFLIQTPKEEDWDAALVMVHNKSTSQMISSLENNQTLSDVVIISKDGLEYSAHRWVLSHASDVFEAMFRADMLEKGSGLVKMDDLSGKAVKILLHFIYSGKMAKEWKSPGTVEEIAYVADKYQIMNMKNYIDANIGKLCNIENAKALFLMATRFGLKRGATAAYKFIVENGNNQERMFEMLSNCSNGFQTGDKNVVTDTVTSTSITGENLPSATRARRGRKRKCVF